MSPPAPPPPGCGHPPPGSRLWTWRGARQQRRPQHAAAAQLADSHCGRAHFAQTGSLPAPGPSKFPVGSLPAPGPAKLPAGAVRMSASGRKCHGPVANSQRGVVLAALAWCAMVHTCLRQSVGTMHPTPPQRPTSRRSQRHQLPSQQTQVATEVRTRGPPPWLSAEDPLTRPQATSHILHSARTRAPQTTTQTMADRNSTPDHGASTEWRRMLLPSVLVASHLGHCIHTLGAPP